MRIADRETATKRVGMEKVRIASMETVTLKTVWISGRETVKFNWQGNSEENWQGHALRIADRKTWMI